MTLNFRKIHQFGSAGFDADGLGSELCMQMQFSPDQLHAWLRRLSSEEYWARSRNETIEEAYCAVQQEYLQFWGAEAGATLINELCTMAPRLFECHRESADGTVYFAGEVLAPVAIGGLLALAFLIDRDAGGVMGYDRLSVLRTLDHPQFLLLRNVPTAAFRALEQDVVADPTTSEWILAWYDHYLQRFAGEEKGAGTPPGARGVGEGSESACLTKPPDESRSEI